MELRVQTLNQEMLKDLLLQFRLLLLGISMAISSSKIYINSINIYINTYHNTAICKAHNN